MRGRAVSAVSSLAALAALCLSAVFLSTCGRDRETTLSQGNPQDTLAASLSGLPLFEVPVPESRDPRMAVMYSGDGGWVGIDHDISGGLAKKGVPTLGVSSLRYFWKRRTQEEGARDLARIIRYYSALWGKRDVILLGYSLGADALPALASSLPPDLLNRVVLIGLLGPAKSYELEFHLLEWIPIDQEFRFTILPDLEKLRGKRILCIYGKQESVSLCPALDPALARSVHVPGGHHFRAHFESIVGMILEMSALRGDADAPRGGASAP